MFGWIYDVVSACVTSLVIGCTMYIDCPIYFKGDDDYKLVSSRQTMMTYTMVSYSLMSFYYVCAMFGFHMQSLFEICLCNNIFITIVCTYLIIPQCRDDYLAMKNMFSVTSIMAHNINSLMMLWKLVELQTFTATNIIYHIYFSFFYLLAYGWFQYKTGIQFYRFFSFYRISSYNYIIVFLFCIDFLHAFMYYFTSMLVCLNMYIQYILTPSLGLALSTWC